MACRPSAFLGWPQDPQLGSDSYGRGPAVCRRLPLLHGSQPGAQPPLQSSAHSPASPHGDGAEDAGPGRRGAVPGRLCGRRDRARAAGDSRKRGCGFGLAGADVCLQSHSSKRSPSERPRTAGMWRSLCLVRFWLEVPADSSQVSASPAGPRDPPPADGKGPRCRQTLSSPRTRLLRSAVLPLRLLCNGVTCLTWALGLREW